MTSPLSSHVNYLQTMLAGARNRTDLHRHQIDAYEQLLAIAKTSDTIEKYYDAVKSATPCCDIARAEQLDRYNNARALYTNLHANEHANACQQMLDALQTVTNPSDLAETLSETERKVTSNKQAERQLGTLASRIVVALVQWSSESQPEQKIELQHAITKNWQLIEQQYPKCKWTQLSQQEYIKQRFPFSADYHKTLEALLQQVITNEKPTS